MRLYAWVTVFACCIVQVACASNATCKEQIILYNSGNQTAVRNFPNEGNDSNFVGKIDLHSSSMNNIPLTLNANFCTEYIKSAKFVVTNLETGSVVAQSIVNTAPFQMTGDNSKPPAFLKQGGNYKIIVYGSSKTNAHGASLRRLTLYLQVLPKIRVSDIAFVDANTGKDVDAAFSPADIVSSPNPVANLYLNYLPKNTKLSIRVNKTIGTVNSVKFELVGVGLSANNSQYTFLDDQAPFTFAGDSGSHINAASILSYSGTYKLTITAFSGKNGTGDMGSLTYDLKLYGFYFSDFFAVLDANSKAELWEIYASPDSVPSFYLSDYPANTSITIRSYMEGTGSGIEYKLSKYQKVDATYTLSEQVQLEDPVPIYHAFQTKSPFPLAGFLESGKLKSLPALLHSGAYRLEAFAYAGANKTYLADYQTADLMIYPRFSASLSVVNTKSGKNVQALVSSIDLSDYPVNATTFTIQADTTGNVGSVAFRLFRQVNDTTNVEVLATVANNAPFRLNGNHAVSVLSVPGRYRVQYTLYSKTHQGGDAGFTESVDFTVLPRLYISSFELVDASSKTVLDSNIGLIDLGAYPAKQTFSIVATTSKQVKSILFTVDRYNKDQMPVTLFETLVTGATPFPLGGKSSNGHYLPVETLKVAGRYRLWATVKSEIKGEKDATLYQDFYVAPQFGIDNFAFVDASKGKDLTNLWLDNALDLSQYPKSTSFDIRAVKHGNIDFVTFELYRLSSTNNNNTQSKVKSSVDHKWPFSVSASNSTSYSAVSSLRNPGYYRLFATPSATSNNSSSITQGLTMEYDFRVIERRGSCYTYCGEDFVPDTNADHCSCHVSCVEHGNCCNDYCEQCASLNATICK